MMKVTVCQLNSDDGAFEDDWAHLIAHVKRAGSDLILLPEMPFAPWVAAIAQYDRQVWEDAVAAHEAWLARLEDGVPAPVLATRPINQAGRRLNEGFLHSPAHGYRGVHTKVYLPDEEGVWEASWYDPGPGEFVPGESGDLRFGFLICSELWAMDQARRYGKAGVHLIATPRATGADSLDKWLVGGRAAAIVSGAYVISSNRTCQGPPDFGGQGWIIGPDGEVIGTTSDEAPFLTVEIDPDAAEAAKERYPRYVFT